MNPWNALAALAAVYIPMLALPGPNFLAVTRASLDESRRHGVATALGVASGSTLQATLAAVGVGWLLGGAAPVLRVVALIGSAYLLYLAISMWRGAGAVATQARAPQRRAASTAASFRTGLLTNITNPKALVFFSTLFVALLGPGSTAAERVVAVMGICVFSTTWHLSLVTLFTNPAVRERYLRARPVLLRVASLLVGAFGLRLAFEALSGR